MVFFQMVNLDTVLVSMVTAMTSIMLQYGLVQLTVEEALTSIFGNFIMLFYILTQN